MRILQVSDGYPPATGGLERTVQGLARELDARGHVVHVATLGYPGAADLETEVTTGSGVTVHRLRGLTRHLQRFSTDPGHHFHPTAPDPQLVRRLRELVARVRPDVVHAHGWMLNSVLSLDLPAGCALVVTLHDYGLTCATKTLVPNGQLDRCCPGPSLARCLPCARRTYGGAKGTALTLGLRERRRTLPRVDLFLPISRAVAAASLARVEAERVRVLPSPVAADLAAVAAQTARPAFLPVGDFVLFVGALGEHKGVGVLAEAHRRMRHRLPLVLVGSARADTVRPAGTADRPVHIATGVPHAEIMAAHAAAAVLAVPSRWPEPQGLVPIEAMTVGTPVVASRVGGLQEVVRDRVSGLLVRPGDPAALAAALDTVLADPALAARLGAGGRATAVDYTADVVVPQVLQAYRDARALAAERHRPGAQRALRDARTIPSA